MTLFLGRSIKMPKFTQGPWRVEWRNDYGDAVIWAEPHTLLAHSGASECNTDANEANARLIAASPELYEAAAEFVRRVESGEVKSVKTYATFKAILAKVDGGE